MARANVQTRLDMNLLPKRYRQGLLSPLQIALIALLIATIGFVVPAYRMAAASMTQVETLSKESAILESEVAVITEKQQRLTKLEGEIAKYEAVLGQRGTISDNYYLIIAAADVEGITVTEIDVLPNDLQLTGTVDNSEGQAWRTLREFRNALSERQDFASVSLGPLAASSTAQQIISFRMAITLAESS